MQAWLLPALLTATAGLGLVVQQAMNAQLRSSLNSAAWSGLASYLVGTLCMIAVALAMRDPLPAAALFARAPWWAWWGGAFGALYIVIGILMLPVIGATAFVGFLMAGQLIASLAFDHFGLFGLAQRTIDPWRLAGAALLVAGAILIRK